MFTNDVVFEIKIGHVEVAGAEGAAEKMNETHDSPLEIGYVEERNAVRKSLLLGTEVDSISGVETGRIRNLSATGAFIELARTFPIKEQLLLKFRGFDQIKAVVVRTTEKGVGVRFVSPIDPAICRRTITSPPQDPANDYVVCQLEGNRQARWDNASTVKRPAAPRS